MEYFLSLTTTGLVMGIIYALMALGLTLIFSILGVINFAHSLQPELIEIVTDELNVKQFEFVQQASELVEYQVLPDNKLLGPRFGQLFPKVRSALQSADPGAVAACVIAGQPYVLEVDGQPIELAAQEILVQTRPAAGLAVAADRNATVAVDAQVTPELRREGMAREVVRRVQAMRKAAGFDISDRITIYYEAESEFAQIFHDWAAYIQAETLSTALVAGTAPEGAYRETHDLDGKRLQLGVMRK